MGLVVSRRGLLAALTPANGPLVDAHVHLFASDKKSFPVHPNATYDPPPAPLEAYNAFVKQAGIAHAIIVHPEPYQDDHRYLEYCFAHEPSKEFFKGTCLFDPLLPETEARIAALQKKWPRRIVALRIHRTQVEPNPSGAIHDRPLDAPQMPNAWSIAGRLGIAIQMHFIPRYATQIGKLIAREPAVPVILDHLGRNGQGSEAEWKDVLALAKFPKTILKFSGVNYSSTQPFPHRDGIPRVKQAFDAFGADRIVWGGLGMNLDEFQKANQLFNEFFAFTTGANRAKIRGGNALRLFGWKT